MIEEGVLENPPVDACLALHLLNHLPAGQVGVRDGAMFASVDEFRILIKGKGGHAAHPEALVDPVLASAQVINALHHIVSRNVAASESAVLSIGTINGGTAFNIIPDQVEMKGTLRTFDDGVRDRVIRRMEEVLSGVTSGMGAYYEFQDTLQSPVVVNDPVVTDLVRNVATRLVGKEKVVEAEPSSGGDDMAYFQQRVPGCYFVVSGASRGEQVFGPHHSAGFNFDEEALKVGLKVMCGAALEYLS